MIKKRGKGSRIVSAVFKKARQMNKHLTRAELEMAIVRFADMQKKLRDRKKKNWTKEWKKRVNAKRRRRTWAKK